MEVEVQERLNLILFTCESLHVFYAIASPLEVKSKIMHVQRPCQTVSEAQSRLLIS